MAMWAREIIHIHPGFNTVGTGSVCPGVALAIHIQGCMPYYEEKFMFTLDTTSLVVVSDY
jgi:hypothetical protein